MGVDLFNKRLNILLYLHDETTVVSLGTIYY